MTTPPDLLAGLSTRIAGIINAHLAGLATCKGVTGRLDLEALKTTTFPAPAVVVSRIGMGQAEGYSGPAWSYDLQMAAFVITIDKLGLRRDEANAAICQQLLGLIPGRVWALPDYLGGARNVQETAQHTSAVTHSITDVARSAGDTGATAERVLGAATDLSQQADRLTSEVSKFLTSIRAA